MAVPLPDMPAALKRGDVDAIAIWEPQAHNSEQALGADAIVFQDRSVYRELFNLNTTAEVFGDPVRRKALVTAVARVVTASEQVTSRPPSVWPLVSSKINVPGTDHLGGVGPFRFAGGLPRDLLDVMIEERALGRRHSEARPVRVRRSSARRPHGSARRTFNKSRTALSRPPDPGRPEGLHYDSGSETVVMQTFRSAHLKADATGLSTTAAEIRRQILLRFFRISTIA